MLLFSGDMHRIKTPSANYSLGIDRMKTAPIIARLSMNAIENDIGFIRNPPVAIPFELL